MASSKMIGVVSMVMEEWVMEIDQLLSLTHGISVLFKLLLLTDGLDLEYM
jgi:hypothetical protein